MKTSRTLIFGSAWLASGSLASAATVMPVMFVTASRMSESLLEVPYTSSVITADVFTNGVARTLPEALEEVPGIMVQKTTHGHGSPFIRGFTGRQNLYLVDGIRLNNSAWRSGPVQYANTLDPLAIEKLEVVKGQGSVLFGSDAIGGTVNAITKSSGFRDMEAGQFFNHGAAYYRFDTNSESHVGRLESTFGSGDAYGVTLGISGKDYGDIRDSALGTMKHTGYDELDIDAKLEIALAQDITLTLAHQYMDQDDVWRWHSTIYNAGWDHDEHMTLPGTYLNRIYDQERSLSYAKLEGENANSFIDRWSTTLSYQTHDESEEQYRALVDHRFQVFEVDTAGLSFVLESDIGPGTAVYGADFYRDEVDSFGRKNDLETPDMRPIADNSTYESTGIFAQYHWQAPERLELTFGSRYSRAEVDLGKYWDPVVKQDLSASDDWDEVTSSIRALYKLNDCWNIYGGISQGFRAPNLDDLSGNLTSRSGATSLGSVDVEPEDFINYELGTRHHSGPYSFGAAVFYTDIDNIITGVPITDGSTTLVTTNGQEGYVYGIELEAAWRITPDWTLSLIGSWQDGRSETPAYIGGSSSEQPISRLQPLSGTTRLRWSPEASRFWIEGEVTARDQAGRLTVSDKTDTQRIPTDGTPGYIVASLRGGWQVNDHVLVTLGLENLTDEDYRIHGSGVNEPGFNAIFGTRVTW